MIDEFEVREMAGITNCKDGTYASVKEGENFVHVTVGNGMSERFASLTVSQARKLARQIYRIAWCPKVEGQPGARVISRCGKTRADAIAAWNQRA